LQLRYLFIIFCFLSTLNIGAHGDLHKRITNVTEEIQKNPDSAKLYFKRGKLYYQHNNYENSLEDFNFAKKLGFHTTEQDFLIAKSNYHLEKYSKSKRLIKRILRIESNNISALKLLADIYFKKEKYEKSAQLYDKVIYNSKVTFPEYYLYASQAWHATNTMDGFERSQSILLKGLEKLGDIIVLYDQLISNYLEVKDFNSAIKFQEKVIKMSNRKERAFLRLADIQIQQELFNEAEISISQAEENFKKLPHRIRNAQFMREFYSELQLKKSSLKNRIR
jgi:tetratricopeptide (TPR) repeat protein